MGKFLLGLLTGAVLIVIIIVIGFFAIASLKSNSQEALVFGASLEIPGVPLCLGIELAENIP